MVSLHLKRDEVREDLISRATGGVPLVRTRRITEPAPVGQPGTRVAGIHMYLLDEREPRPNKPEKRAVGTREWEAVRYVLKVICKCLSFRFTCSAALSFAVVVGGRQSP
jgi:hypothetical protein